ncbi:DUF2510 domain-containing protein [Arthrobacter sp. StoSoilB5]|jgi:hypothetical protein|uniref:DUF2510 domain-containing protein n=1 Tax=Arthrobacter sp. StoSoilB5 TaxID=2830992 RepID=UPI001CC5FA32|nr:DUF2510 domain-containing protein [Arthrobacter sp. StoSoilB5]BCW46586.1 hypothetical protein StoSoilB5_37700 [Arthrobacter sp. StoSoilB5]
MTHAPNGSMTPAGWYPDPSFPQQMRWWDGVQWTPHLAPASQQFMPLQRVLISNQTPVYNPFIWTVVLLPLVSILLMLTWQPEFRMITTRQGATTIDPMSLYTPGYFLLQASGVIIYGVSVLMAYLDHRRLGRSGVVRPFHWAWCFLSPAVYVIGRTVIVRKVAPGRGMWPVWALIGTFVLSMIVAGIWMSAMMQSLYSQIGYSINA